MRKLAVFVLITASIAYAFTSVPSKSGPYSTKSADITVGTLMTGGSQQALIFYPEPETQQQFPVILFGHGMTGGGWKLYVGYIRLLWTLASYGYFIIAPKSCPDVWCNNWPDDIETTIDTIIKNPGQFSQALEKYADFSQIALVGHSMGGNAVTRLSTSSEFLAKYNVKASVAFNPAVEYDKLTHPDQIKVPMFFITGTKDTTVPPQNVYNAYLQDQYADKIYINVVGNGHQDCTIKGWNTMNSYAAKYLQCKVKGDADSCKLFYDKENEEYLCTNGTYTFQGCYIDMP